MKYSIYDFDQTIYHGDSTLDFYFYCLKKNPRIMKYWFQQLWYFGLYLLGIVSKKKMKEHFFCFLKSLSNVTLTVDEFWIQNASKLKKWYLEKKHDNDIIISASPDFLLKPICEGLEVSDLIATTVDSKTGEFLSENCYGKEKVKRLQEKYPKITVSSMYTDSLSDQPLLDLASVGFIVTGDQIVPIKDYHMPLVKKLKHLFLSQKFVMFVIVGCLNTLNGVLFSYLYSLCMGPTIAFVVGYMTSLIFSYLLNSYLTFKDKKLTLIKFVKFCISYIPNFLIQLGCVALFLNVFQFHKLIAYIVAAIIGIPITFVALSIFTFGKNKIK